MKRKILILFLTICVLFTLSSVCANELDDSKVNSVDGDQIDVKSSQDDNSQLSLEKNNGDSMYPQYESSEIDDEVDNDLSKDTILGKSNDDVIRYNIAESWDYELIKTPKNYGDRELIIKVVEERNRLPIPNVTVNFYWNNNHKSGITNSDGEVKYILPFVYGTHKIDITINDKTDGDDRISYDYYDGGFPTSVAYLKLSIKGIDIPTKLTTSFPSGKYFQAKLVDYNFNKPLKDVKLLLKIFTGKTYKTITLTTDSNGVAKYELYKLSVGSHKLKVSIKDTVQFKANSKSSSIKISKPSLKVSAPKVRNIYKKGVFKVTVKNKKFGNPMKGVLVKIKVYTGKKYKIYKIKTNSNGVASLKTKSLKKGSHKVVVSIKGNSKYKSASVKSKIVIVKNKIKTKFTREGPNGQMLDFLNPGGIFAGIKIYPKLTDANGKVLKKKITVKTAYRTINGKSGEGFSLSTSEYYDGKATIIFAEDNYYCGTKFVYTF
ncbi:Ig-like domain-containing protein [Methanobrevibacter sp.]|uniref:Ig-like domain-containing protein n=1 Tax=Methanobrevibacter sp. TaxID=66852 RepID=UPI003870B890